MLAPSSVPMVRAPFKANFMLPVPEASLPAVEICSDRSAAGIDALGVLHAVGRAGRRAGGRSCRGSLLMTSPTLVDELDDELGRHVAGRGLAAEDDGARGFVARGIELEPVVERDGVQDVAGAGVCTRGCA